METVTVESIPITLGREEDYWWADIESMPGVMACGETREAAIAAVHALALRVAADCIDHGEEVPAAPAKVFSAAWVIGVLSKRRNFWRRCSGLAGR
jgi:predicted RNase H-like HicB family nuclease